MQQDTMLKLVCTKLAGGLAKCNLLGATKNVKSFVAFSNHQFFLNTFSVYPVKVLDRAMGFSFRLYIEETTSGPQGEGGAIKNMQEWKGKKHVKVETKDRCGHWLNIKVSHLKR